jgi:glycosyltransferase involved in cell wall biosynthesis
MNRGPVRVALFACAYNEIDGVANTCHRFEEFGQRRGLPFLNVHGGFDEYVQSDGSLVRREFQRRWPKFALDKKHDFDLLFWRYYRRIQAAVREFKPDLVHITGPSDIGQLGALVAHNLSIPLAASWHTNVHEYAEQRFLAMAGFMPEHTRLALGTRIRQWTFQRTARFYRMARLLFAPNPELVEALEKATGKPCHIMARGVDTELFRPERRDSHDAPFTVGYVGRFTTEKNIRFLAELEKLLGARGHGDFRLLLVGQGAEEPWLRANLRRAEFAGVLQGEPLARAYANIDVFAFPSRTDTFGNVVLEALASGVPAVVTNGGGPKFIVRHGEDGFVAQSDAEFVDCVSTLIAHPERLAAMRVAAREHALQASWDAVFERVYGAYEEMLEQPQCAAENKLQSSSRAKRGICFLMHP